MFKFARLLIFEFVVCHVYLMAEPTLPGVVAATDGDPGSLAAGCVNVITGDLVLGKEDISVRGAVSLPLHRNYASGNGKAEDGNCGWHLFFPHFILKFMDTPYSGYEAVVTIPSGSTLHFYQTKNKKQGEMHPFVRKHAVGMANNSSGIISGRTNFKNARIFFKKKNNLSDVELVTPEGLHCYYDLFKKKGDIGTHIFVLVREELANGCWILYEHDKYGRPTFAKVVNPAQNKVFSWARFHWEGSNNENHDVRVETSDKRELRYSFERRKGKKSEGGYRYHLQNITGSIPTQEDIVFAAPPKDFNSLLTEMKAGGELIQKIAYFYPEKKGPIKDKHDLRCNRVKEIRRPVGPNGEEVCTHRFSYPKVEWKDDMSCCKKGGTGIVEGPHGFKTTYEWSKELRPQWIRLFDSDQIQIMHELVWGPENPNDSGNLYARALLNDEGRYLWIKSYTYDDRFNPITETLRGNLTGNNISHFSINDCKIEGGETYTHHYCYSNDGRNLLLEDREDNGRVIRYQYLPGTALLSAKLTGDAGHILQRELYEYDADNLLIAEIIDDGSASDPKDLKGVTHRVFKRTYRRPDGLPEKIEEGFYDKSTFQERPIKSIILHYNPKLLVSSQDIFDSEGNRVYSLFFEYDDKDRLVRKTDPQGNPTTISYDHAGRPIQTKLPNGNIETISYDANSRPIACTKNTPEGQSHTERFFYNALNHKTSSVDVQGCTTRFFPDPWGRNKQIEYPDGSNEKITYSAMGFPTRIVSRGGATTSITYNAYGKPTAIQHPDGSEEMFTYDRAGYLIQSTDRLGTSTIFTYDFLGRVIHQQVIDGSGQKLKEEKSQYVGPLLIRNINAEGECTDFEYDAAGRKIAEHKNGATQRFAYDTLGRLCTISSAEATRETVYDVLDRVICERTISATGELHQETTYSYNTDGQLIEKSTSTLQGPSIEKSTYDGFGRQTSKTDPLGHKTFIDWDESTPGLIRKIITDPMGTRVIETIGPMERLISKEVLSPQNTRLALTNYTYDAEGHCIEEHVHLQTRTIVTKRTYHLGKITTLIEAAGTPEQKTTSYTYKQDLLNVVRKNDGTELHYSYDPLGRVSICQASTGEGYSYTYDHLDRIIAVTDLSRDHTSTRTYDASGAIFEDGFMHGLSIRYLRDSLGKPLALILPDETAIGYRWEASHLKEVSRLDEDGNVRYAHTYDQYELTGSPIASTLIFGLGSEKMHYDLAHRPLERCTPFHHHIAKLRNPLGSLLEAQSRFIDILDDAQYSYDPLQQLQSESSRFHNHSFHFDAHGTLLQRDEKPCKTNSLYQLEKVGDIQCTYTPAGNLASDGRFTYSYDAFDRLVAVEEPNVQKAEYVYDSWHRRMQKVLYNWEHKNWVQASTQFYLYDGMLEIGSTDLSGNIIELRLLGQTSHADTGATIAIESKGHIYAPLHDIRGNITALIDTFTGQLAEVYRYSAFGDVKIFDANHNPTTSKNPWRYFGKRTDEETGLILFGRRYYHTQLGKWITPDPAQTLDHPNLYLFLRANPLNLHDALGLRADPNTFYTPDRPNIFTEAPVGLALNRVAKATARPVGYALYYGAYELPVPYIRDGIMWTGSAMCRNKRCVLENSSYYYLPGNGLKDNQSIIRGNGIHTTKEEALRGGQNFCDMLDGHPVWVFHNATKGYILDLLDCGLEWCGVKTDVARVGIEGRKAIYTEALKYSDNPTLNVITHSEGCLLEEVINTELKKTHHEINNHTFLYALGSPKIPSPDLVHEVDIRISKWDGVGWIDVFGRLQDHDHVTILKPIGGFPCCDHGIQGETYLNEIEKIARDIRRRQNK